jgi:hypothetical protein
MRRRQFIKSAFAGAIAASVMPGASSQTHGQGIIEKGHAKHIRAGDSVAMIIDVQEVFLSHLDRYRRSKVVWHTKDFARLVRLFDIPVVVTLEKPIAEKGSLPAEIAEELNDVQDF